MVNATATNISEFGLSDVDNSISAVGTAAREQMNAVGTAAREQMNAVGTAAREQMNAVGTAAGEQMNAVGTAARGCIDAGVTGIRSKIKDPVSCITHLVSAVCALLFSPVRCVRAASHGAGRSDIIALAIFVLSMVLLYSASASYHGFRLKGEAGLVLKRLDHMMIFVLIAGTYTPICVCAMKEQGIRLLITVWSLASAGMLFKLFWVTCPKWISSVIYITMGWVVVFAMPKLIPAVNTATLVWLYAGGVIYTIGGVLYALKLIKFNSSHTLWGSHEIFHLFVMGGSLCHFIFMFRYVL